MMPRETLPPEDEWVPTPDWRRFKARLLDGAMVEFTELKIGDVFEIINPDGQTVDPWNGMPDNSGELHRCIGEAKPNPYTNEGFAVEIVSGARQAIIGGLS